LNDYPKHPLKILCGFFPGFFTDSRGSVPLSPSGIEMKDILDIGNVFSTPPPGVEFTVHPGNKKMFSGG
jgi:hypothetical protein